MDKYTRDSLNRLIEYVYDDEQRNWEESGEPQDHIFADIKTIVAWLEKQ